MPYTHTFADIKNRPVAVFGAGTLGRRIALMFASRGGTVRMHDPSALQVRAATEYVAQTLPEVVEKRGSGEVGLVQGRRVGRRGARRRLARRRGRAGET